MLALVFPFIIIQMSVHPNHIANGNICLSAILSIHITYNKLKLRFYDYFCYVFSTLTISLHYVEYLILNTLNIEYWCIFIFVGLAMFWSVWFVLADLGWRGCVTCASDQQEELTEGGESGWTSKPLSYRDSKGQRLLKTLVFSLLCLYSIFRCCLKYMLSFRRCLKKYVSVLYTAQ